MSHLSRITVTILICWSLIPIAAHANVADYAETLHFREWKTIAHLANKNQKAKIGIYASRTLAVVHPEIYLNADRQLMKWIEAHSDTAVQTYSPPTLSQVFDWHAISKYSVSTFRKLYPDSAPFLFIVDRRVLSPTAWMRTLVKKKGGWAIEQGHSATELNKAIIAYSFFKNSLHQKPYILHCDNENTYLISNSQVISMKARPDSNITCSPLLIFNEEYVWYPLMGRDDSPRSLELATLVKRYVRNQSPLPLSHHEQTLLESLKESTTISTDEEMKMIHTIVQNITPMGYIENGEIVIENLGALAQWQEVVKQKSILSELTVQRMHVGISSLILQDVHSIANRLSPITALLAATLVKQKSKTASTLAQEYLKFFRWGEVWAWGLTDFTIDESFVAGGGGVCVTHAANISSILHLLDIPHYVLHTYHPQSQKDHRIVYVPKWKATFSNGRIASGSGHSLFDPIEFNSVIYVGYRDAWAYLSDPVFLGTMDKQSLFKHLIFLKNQFDDPIRGIRIPTEWIKTPPQNLSWEELLNSAVKYNPTYGLLH